MNSSDSIKKGIDHIGVAVVYFCHNGNGKVLMAQRSENARDEHHRWDIGGGAVEFRQNLEEALKKEIKEEYCAEVLDYQFLGHREIFREHGGQDTHWITLDFKVLIDPANVAIGEPHKFTNIGWFTKETMPESMHSQLPHFLKKYQDHLPF